MSCIVYLRGEDKGGVRLFQISQKERLFHVLYQPSYNHAMWSPFIAPFQKRPFFPLQFGQEENISGKSTERRVYWFIIKIARVLPVPTGRVGIGWWTLLIIVNITSLGNKFMLLVHFKKVFPLTLLGQSFKRRAYWLLFHFQSSHGIPYSTQSK